MTLPTPLWRLMGNTFWFGVRYMKPLEATACLPLNVLEDIELAKIFKVSGHRIWFGYGAGLVRTRMYRTFSAMWEGWSKGLAILFRRPVLLAARRALEFVAIALLLAAGLGHDGSTPIWEWRSVLRDRGAFLSDFPFPDSPSAFPLES